MAKSIRSKKKRAFRAIKRAQVFQPVEDARLKRLARRVGSLTTEEPQETNPDNATKIASDKDAAPMEVDTGKTSTSGVRGSGRAQKRMQVLSARRKGMTNGFSKKDVKKIRRR